MNSGRARKGPAGMFRGYCLCFRYSFLRRLILRLYLRLFFRNPGSRQFLLKLLDDGSLLIKNRGLLLKGSGLLLDDGGLFLNLIILPAYAPVVVLAGLTLHPYLLVPGKCVYGICRFRQCFMVLCQSLQLLPCGRFEEVCPVVDLICPVLFRCQFDML